jgi:hypothetical protein
MREAADQHRARGPSLVEAAVLAALLAISILAVAGVEYLPTNDGPRHVFAVHAAHHLDAPGRGWSTYFDSVTPLTSLGFGALFGPLDHWLTWRSALRLTLAALVVVWIAGAWLLARTLHRERAWLGIALGGAACQWTLYMGFFSFHAASGIGLLVLAVGLARPAWSRQRGLAIAALLLAQALCHVAAAAFTGSALLVLAIARAAPERRLRALVQVACIGLPAACVAFGTLASASLLVAQSESEGAAQTLAAPLWTLGECFAGGPAWRAWPLTLAALAAFGFLRSRRADDRGLLVAGGALLAAAALVPLHLPVWQFVSVRFLPLGIALLVATLPLERLRGGARPVAAALCVLFALASGGWAVGHGRALAADAAEALAGLDAGVSRDGPRLPILLDTGLETGADAAMPYAAPLANLAHLYAVEQGGVLPYNFAVNPAIHHLRLHDDAYRRYPPIPDGIFEWAHVVRDLPDEDPGSLRAAVLTHAAGYGAFYQDVVLWGRPDDAELLLHRGYVADFRHGGLLIARFEGCPLRVRVPDSALDGAVEIGWYPLDETARRVPLRRATRVDGALALELENGPCGAAWIRVTRGGRGSPHALPCRGVDAEGRLIVPSTRRTPDVRCDVEGTLARRD